VAVNAETDAEAQELAVILRKPSYRPGHIRQARSTPTRTARSAEAIAHGRRVEVSRRTLAQVTARATGCGSTYAGRGRRPQSSHTIPYRLTPADVTAIWRRTSLCVHELTGPRNRWSRVISGTSRTAPPTAGQADACSAQTRFGPWLVTAIQPHASHTTSINGARIGGMRASRTRSSQSTRLPRAGHPFHQNPASR